jgi:hypothetical protein
MQALRMDPMVNEASMQAWPTAPPAHVPSEAASPMAQASPPALVSTHQSPVVVVPEDVEAQEQNKVCNFIESVSRATEPPILSTTLPRCRARTLVSPCQEPCRSRHLARMCRARPTGCVAQAQKVLMKKLGIISGDQPPSPRAAARYEQFFEQPLSLAHCKALQVKSSRLYP